MKLCKIVYGENDTMKTTGLRLYIEWCCSKEAAYDLSVEGWRKLF